MKHKINIQQVRILFPAPERYGFTSERIIRTANRWEPIYYALIHGVTRDPSGSYLQAYFVFPEPVSVEEIQNTFPDAFISEPDACPYIVRYYMSRESENPLSDDMIYPDSTLYPDTELIESGPIPPCTRMPSMDCEVCKCRDVIDAILDMMEQGCSRNQIEKRFPDAVRYLDLISMYQYQCLNELEEYCLYLEQIKEE